MADEANPESGCDENSRAGADETLTVIEELVLGKLFEGVTIDEIARSTGRTVGALWKMRQKPNFKRALGARCSAGMERARMVLAEGVGEAANELMKLATRKGEETNPKMAAVQSASARAVIESLIKLGDYAGDGAPKKSEVAVTGGVAAIPVWSGSQADFEKAAMDAQAKLQAESQPDHGDEEA